MLLIFIMFVASTAIVIGSRVRMPERANASELGWMSEKWLTRCRASHLS
jgi:hypothetical protein